MKNSYGPPTAPWYEGDEESVFPLVLRRSADVLADRLEARVAMLRRADVTTDDVCMEIRRHIASASIDDPLAAGIYADLLLELLAARENSKRAL